MIRKLFKKFHLWLSLPFGVIISIICFTGAILVFETEIMELRYPDRYFVSKIGEKTIPIDELLNSVSGTLPDSVTIASVTISSDPQRAYQVGLSKPRRAAMAVDQYTGEVKGKIERAPFFSFVFRAHRWLLDSMKPSGEIFWGRVIVGVSTLLFVIILITGIVIWWPRNLKYLKGQIKIPVRRGWRSFWYGLHSAGGMYVSIFLLAMALTGLTWSFTWYRTGFLKLFGAEPKQTSGRGHGAERSPRGQATTYTNWQYVYDQLNTSSPDNRQISISAGTANVYLNRTGNRRGSDRYTFDPATGEITSSNPYNDQDRSDKIRGWIYSVHVGDWGGMFTRILSFVAALIGGTLPLTGYYIWIRRRMRKRRNYSKQLLQMK